jgi:hypothetical protein
MHKHRGDIGVDDYAIHIGEGLTQEAGIEGREKDVF